MYLQTVMLLLRAEGLHSCPQVAWAKFHETAAGIVRPSIGFEAPSADRGRTGRAPLGDTVTFVED